jgi:hypothetical protein
MKTTISKFIGAMAVGLSLAQAVQSAQINGTIGFTGRVVLNTGSASTASQVIGWVNPTVNGTSGNFTSIANNAAVKIFSPWSFVSGAINPTTAGGQHFWSVGGFTFDLISSSVLRQGGSAGSTGFVTVSGTGTVSGNNFDPTTIIWNFSTQDPRILGNPDTFTFSVSQVTTPTTTTHVPDSGVTLVAFALALAGTALFRKKLAV